MTVQLELTVDSETGEAFIKFTHYDKSEEISQKVLGSLINKAKEKGIKLHYTGGYSGNGQSYDSYEIRICDGEYEKHIIASQSKYSQGQPDGEK